MNLDKNHCKHKPSLHRTPTNIVKFKFIYLVHSLVYAKSMEMHGRLNQTPITDQERQKPWDY